MKMKEILNESPTDLVARFWKDAEIDKIDSKYNREANYFSEENQQYYKDFNVGKGITPVFTKSTNFHDEYAEPNSNQPQKGEYPSAGWRGQQQAKQRADMPYKDYPAYDSSAYSPDEAIDTQGQIKRTNS